MNPLQPETEPSRRAIPEKTRAAKARWEKEHAAERALAKAHRRKANRWQTWAMSCINGKRAAGEEVSLTWRDIETVLTAQNGRCAITELPFWKATRADGSVSWDSPSLDRIAHDGPYSRDNVRIVLHCVNTFRGRLADDQMVYIARRIVKRLTNKPTWIEARSSFPRKWTKLYD